jgi:hypothetical protein
MGDDASSIYSPLQFGIEGEVWEVTALEVTTYG